jgi:hypothetical protein
MPPPFVYIIVQGGLPYTSSYTTYEAAVAAVKEKNKETLEYEKALAEEMGEPLDSDIDIPENTESPVTNLFLCTEKTTILICKLPVLTS